MRSTFSFSNSLNCSKLTSVLSQMNCKAVPQLIHRTTDKRIQLTTTSAENAASFSLVAELTVAALVGVVLFLLSLTVLLVSVTLVSISPSRLLTFVLFDLSRWLAGLHGRCCDFNSFFLTTPVGVLDSADCRLALLLNRRFLFCTTTSLQVFRSRLKTQLFARSYRCSD